MEVKLVLPDGMSFESDMPSVPRIDDYLNFDEATYVVTGVTWSNPIEYEGWQPAVQLLPLADLITE